MNVFVVYKKKNMQKECKSALIMKPAWEEILSKFNEEIRNEVYNAVVEYKGGGILPSLSPLAKMAFTFIKMEIDKSKRGPKKSSSQFYR